MTEISRQLRDAAETIRRFSDWALGDGVATPEGSDFLFGNPHDEAPAGYVEAMQRAAVPDGPEHYAYKMSEHVATEAIAAGLTQRFGMPFDADDVAMTNGNFAGLAIVLRAIADPGDEVIYLSPPWFFYEMLIVASGATPVRVRLEAPSFDLDVDAVRAAISPATRAVIVNSPHNPSGRIYPAEDLDRLAHVLEEASATHGRRVFLISDEAYNHIVYDGRTFPTPTAAYPSSFLLYTYAKTLLSPGSRLGYVAMPRSFPGREEFRRGLMLATIAAGWAFPVSILQQAVPDLERMEADVGALQARRDRLCDALEAQGYELVRPEGTFYVLVRSPLADDEAFCAILAANRVHVLPGAMFEMPGWFRISLTANDDMVDRSIPGFAASLTEARG